MCGFNSDSRSFPLKKLLWLVMHDIYLSATGCVDPQEKLIYLLQWAPRTSICTPPPCSHGLGIAQIGKKIIQDVCIAQSRSSSKPRIILEFVRVYTSTIALLEIGVIINSMQLRNTGGSCEWLFINHIVTTSLTRMWHYSIREWMLTHVGVSIRSLGSTKATCTMHIDLTTKHYCIKFRMCTYSQGEPHDVAKRRVAIFAVIQQSHTKSMLREVRPLVGTHLTQQSGH